MLSKIYYKFLNLWQPSKSIGGSVAKGGAITLVKRFLIKGIQFVETLIIARLLFPDDIGLFAVASLFLTMVEIFFQPGLSGALIQSDDKVENYLDSVWTVNIIRGVVLSTLFLLIAPLGGHFFNNPEVTIIIRVLGLYYLISYCGNVGMLLVQKELRYNRLFVYDMAGILVQAGVTILAAFYLKNVWALVIGMFAGQLALTISSYILHPYRPKLDFRFIGIGRLLKFGKWLGFSGFLAFFVNQGDSLAVGKLLNLSSVAYYQMAFALGTLASLEMVGTLSGLFFPLFAKIKGEPERIRNAFLRIGGIIFAVMLPATFGLAVLARDAVFYLYGERWLAMVPILYVIIVYGFINSFDSLFSPLLQGIGKPQTTFVNLLVRAAVMFSLITVLTNYYGALGAALSITIGLLVSETILFFKVKKEIKFGLMAFLDNSALPLIASLLMALSIFLLKKFLPIHNIFAVFGFVVLGIIIYLILLFGLDYLFGRRFYKTALWIKDNI